MKPMIVYTNKKKIPEINTIKITKEAFQKMNLYSSIVSDIIGSHQECLGTLLNYKDRKDNIVRDIHLWRGQSVDAGHGWPGDSVDDYEEAKSRGMETVGLWHSHGSNGVFHSDFDSIVLQNMYNRTQNKIVISEKDKSIECIIDGETIRLFEEGSNKEIRIKGKIEDIKYVERDECRVLNSIVINNKSYSGGYDNPKLKQDYHAQVWTGYEKDKYQISQDAHLEVLEEANNIQLNEEELVKEVGEKVIFCRNYLKDLPNYQKVLEKHKNIKNQDKPVEQIINDEKRLENTNLQKIVEEQKEPVKQEKEPSQEPQKTKTYMERFEEFRNYLNLYEDSTYKTLAELCKVYSGKTYRFWNERYEESKELIKKLKKKSLTPEQKDTLDIIRNILKSNKYLKRKHSVMYKDLQSMLDADRPDFYNLTQHDNNRLGDLNSKKEIDNSLEEKVGSTNNSTNNSNSSKKTYKKTLGGYLKNIAKYLGIAAFATAMVLLPAKYCQKDDYNRPSIVYTVKKGDNLWNLTKDYMKKSGVKVDNKTVYKTVDNVAKENGKGKQAEYKIGGKEKKNPHFIKPGEKVVFSKKVLDPAKQGDKNE